MKPLRLLFLVFAGSLMTASLPAQVILPLQEHKVLWADTVYREAVLKKDSNQLAEAWYLYGKAYEAAGDLPTARRYYLKSLAIIEPQGPSFHLARLYSRLGNNEIHQGHYKEGYRYTHLSLKIARQVRAEQFISAGYGQLQYIHSKDWSDQGRNPGLPRSRPDSARYYRLLRLATGKQQTQDTLNRLQDTLYRIQMKIEQGQAQWHEDRNSAGIAQLREALQMARKIKRKSMEMGIQYHLAEIHIERKEFSLAEQCLREAERLHEESPFANSFWEKNRLALLYKNYYIGKGLYKEALAYAEEAIGFERSSYLHDREGAISRLEVEYETEKKQLLLKAREEEIALKNANARMLSGFVLLLSVLSVITLGISIQFYRLYRKNQRTSRQNEILMQEQNHRVKNNLQSISSLLSLQSHELQDSKALDVITESRHRVESMSILHRKLYKDENAGYVFLPDFLEEITENVLTSYGLSSVILETELAPVYLAADKAVHLGLIFNELVTNSCKYAFPSHPEPALRIICRSSPAQEIYFRMEDNGQHTYTPAAGEGFGMQLIEMEVAQLYGEHHFSYHNGTVFTLTFPEETH